MGFLLLLTAAALVGCSFANYPWPDNVTQVHGYIEVNKTHGDYYFFWLFESRKDPSTDPLIIWLTGGPGCSSMLGLFMENGPFLLPGGATDPKYNPYGWNSFANLMYVDQPPGTGFSYTTNPAGYTHNESQIAADFWTFLRQFYGQYPKYSQLNLYIIGESYAGHYVPAIGAEIVRSNSIYAKNLKGVAVGNGWVDPLIQYGQYAPFALSNKLINQAQAEQAGSVYARCKGDIEQSAWLEAFQDCTMLVDYVLETADTDLGRNINPYDIRKNCDVEPLCYETKQIDSFLAREDIRKELGIPNSVKWTECDRKVYSLLVGDFVHNFEKSIAVILGHKRRVDVYSGDQDFICNYFGGRNWTLTLNWSGKSDFNKATEKTWSVGGQPAGKARSADGLTFLQVYNAGHLVPMDQPQNALDMVSRFLKDEPF